MPCVLACGAFLKNTACVLDTDAPDTPIWSASHGDLSDPDACRALESSVRDLIRQVGGKVAAVAHDLHPDMFSTQLAQQIAHELAVPAIAVQHHHAHIAAVMAEHGLSDPVLGVALDGVGLGTDGLAWGGEVLWVGGAEFERVGHLGPLALPGGDAAAREPWRMAASVLHACGLAAHIVPRFGAIVGETAARAIETLLARSVNSPATTAAGRWFDAAAGFLGLSVRQSQEAQAAMALEAAATRWLGTHALTVDASHWRVSDAGEIDLRPLFITWMEKIEPPKGDDLDEAAARFHLTISDALVDRTLKEALGRGVKDIVLGGGCFFNAILRERFSAGLGAAGLSVWRSQNISCGDAGLALGQAWVAARWLNLSVSPCRNTKEIVCV